MFVMSSSCCVQVLALHERAKQQTTHLPTQLVGLDSLLRYRSYSRHAAFEIVWPMLQSTAAGAHVPSVTANPLLSIWHGCCRVYD